MVRNKSRFLTRFSRRLLGYYVAHGWFRHVPPLAGRRFDLKLANDGSRRFFHRGTAADLGVMKDIFLDESYSLRRFARRVELMAAYRAIADAGKTPVILDAGANIGASAVYFAGIYPKARIICVEPDPGNFDLLSRNTAGLNVRLHRAALGLHDGRVRLIDPGEGEWGYRTRSETEGDCPMLSVARLVDFGPDENLVPFIAKIDIEGGEFNLFDEPNDWMDRFALVIVELHDWLLPKQRTSHSFLRCVAKYDRDFVHRGENVFSIRIDL